MHSMKLLFTVHVLVFVAVSAATTNLFSTDVDEGYVPTKKKIYYKSPYRETERLRSRQAGNFRHGPSVTSSTNEYAYLYTSPSPEAAWKPITYSLVPDYRMKHSRSTTHGKVVPPHHKTAHIPKENIILVETKHPPNVALDNTPYKNYALLHYYVPFEHVTVTEGKPIEEPFPKVSKKPLTFEHVVKATIEPIPIYTATTSTTTPAPKIEPASYDDEHTDTKENEFTGSYEYEYFVQDNHYGTNFGHKEYRDGKKTKGDYEVVLPDGRVQHVKYWSDASGYHATVTYHPIHRKSSK